METENFSEADSLKLINEMIGKAKKSYVTKGWASIMWGSIIVFCSMATWVRVRYGISLGDVWILTFLAIIPQIYFGFKENKKRGFVSYEGQVISYVWLAFGISIFILSLYINATKAGAVDSASLFMMLYAIPTFITGGVTKFKPMIYGGIFCWAASVLSIFTDFEADNLLMAACGLFAWLIPGIILFKKYRLNQLANV